ncbi:alpha/beta hydrolase [Chondromyces crocatus]|uniref:Alpha/beta hydrolase n=1 Tax=Chondromyces crocatus TaxID=52 RepID=A0A0K1EKU7_CHOCO|nr:alpha/beta hydrolase [Chondromyces crocatus]AKT41451.1 alpha/beta hydrolase [Chondromyces crocatus]
MADSSFHPELRASARWLPRGVVRSWSLWLMARLPTPAPRLPDGVTVEERPLGGTSASVRILRASGSSRRAPVVLWIHGGGYVVGRAKQDDLVCARMAQRLGAVVVSVDYRLASNHPFPAPLDDCVAAWDLLQREAASLGVDAKRAIIAGQSAGGGLAAGLVLRLADSGRPMPILQVLVYPMLDDRTVLRQVDERHHRVWDQNSNAIGWSKYLGRPPGGADVSEHAAAARRADLRGLPPAWIGVGTLDLFHDEDLDYARRLEAAGVPVEVELVPGAYHGFDAVLPRAPVSKAFVEARVRAMERAFHRSTP